MCENQVDDNEDGKIVINFNEYYKYWNFHPKEREEYKAIKEFCEENNYKLILKHYDMTPPTPPLGILY